MTPSRDLQTFDNLVALSTAAAAEVVRIARDSMNARGRFTLALAGGNTPRPAYELLATRHHDEVDWQRTVIVFGDERFVPVDDPRSNYRMASDTLLSRVPVPDTSVHAVQTDAPSVDAAAGLYDATLRQVLDDDGAADHATVDLALLGVGPDGHTASLFPGALQVREQTRWALAVDAPTAVQPAVPRVTVTLPFLNAARVVIFLVAGNDKRPVMREILDGAESAHRYPAALVAPRGRALWMIDRSAMPDERSNA